MDTTTSKRTDGMVEIIISSFRTSNNSNMKQTLTITLAALLLATCTSNDKKLKQRAEELCRYIPDHELLERSQEFMTADFYAVLDTMFNHLPDEEPLEHEWLYYFVTGNGGTIADCKVAFVEKTDNTHAVAHINCFQTWTDSGIYESADMGEPHRLYMEKVDGKWLLADFDEHKADCIRHIAGHRQEQALRDAIGDYLMNEMGQHYQQGTFCVPTIMIVDYEQADSDYVPVLCDCWVEWYNQEGDTLKCVSGGNHSGLMNINYKNGKYTVSSFEQTVDGAGNDASARRIFGIHYDIYQNIHSNPDVRTAARQMQLRNYLDRHHITAHYYQDYGWPAVKI